MALAKTSNQITVPDSSISEKLSKPNISQYIKHVGSMVLKILENPKGFELASCVESKINYVLRSIQVASLSYNIKGSEETVNIETLFGLLTQIASDLKLVIDYNLIDYIVVKHNEKKLFTGKYNTFKALLKQELKDQGIDSCSTDRIIRLIFAYKE